MGFNSAFKGLRDVNTQAEDGGIVVKNTGQYTELQPVFGSN